jgi:hypothetical protein
MPARKQEQVEEDLAWLIERERRALLLLSGNQCTRQHIEAAGRHVIALGRLLRLRAKAAAVAATPDAATAVPAAAQPVIR